MYTTKTAAKIPAVRVAMNELAGKHNGGWAETEQAKARLIDALPGKWDRDWTLGDFIDANFRVDARGFYRIAA